MVDFSHGNSSKQFQRQLIVGDDIARQVSAGEERIVGAMIESHLREGRQNCVPGVQLEYGQSITDACLSWDDTVPLLEKLAVAVNRRREQTVQASA